MPLQHRLFLCRFLTAVTLSVDKEGLVRTIREQEQQIDKLRQEIESLRSENEKLKQKPNSFKEKALRAGVGKRSKPPRLWGRKKGQKGSGRPEPEHIDRLLEQTLQQCPRCQGTLGACEDFEDHFQEDIIPAKVRQETPILMGRTRRSGGYSKTRTVWPINANV